MIMLGKLSSKNYFKEINKRHIPSLDPDIKGDKKSSALTYIAI